MQIDTYEMVMCQADALVRGLIDSHWPVGQSISSERWRNAREAGKALIMVGASFLANSLGIFDPGDAFGPVRTFLSETLPAAYAEIMPQAARDEMMATQKSL